MKIEDFRPVMIRVLSQSSRKGLSVEDVVERLINSMQDLEAVMGSMGGVPIIQATPPAQEKMTQGFGSLDVSQRIGTPEKVNEGLVERYTQEQLSDFSRNQMPSELMVKPPGFDEPFLIKKNIEVAPGGLGYVRLIYQQPQAPLTTQEGQRIGPTVQISTSDKLLDAEVLTADIIKQAENMYTKNPRVLVPRTPPPATRPGDLAGALSAEAPGTGEEGFTLPTAPGGMSEMWRAQRR